MKIFCLLLLIPFCAFSLQAQDVKGEVTIDGGKSTYHTVQAEVLKVFSAAAEGAVYRAYLVEWEGQEVVISASPSLRTVNYEVGDTIRFIVNRFESKKYEMTPALSFNLLPEFKHPKSL